jgi:hypothetical protein
VYVTIHRRFWPAAHSFFRSIKAPCNVTTQPGTQHDQAGTMVIRASWHHLEGLINHLPEEAIVSHTYALTSNVLEQLKEAA